MSGHLDWTRMDALRAGKTDAASEAHLAGCRDCSATVKSLRRLEQKLRARVRPAFTVPESVDRTVLDACQPVRRLQLWIPAAAALLLSVLTLSLWLPTQNKHLERPSEEQRLGVLSGDMNGDGTIDIVDAYVLSLRLKEQAPTNPGWDFNRDGVVDRRDVDSVAQSGVSLLKRGS
jgi:hypothetical protein